MKNIPFSPPDITEEEINEVVRVLRSGWITTGPECKNLKKNSANFPTPTIQSASTPALPPWKWR